MKYIITLNSTRYEVEVEESNAVITSTSQAAAPPPAVAAPAAEPAPQPPPPPAREPADVDGIKVLAPMPGSIVSVKVTEGKAVKAGAVIVVLEAMKMENDIVAPADGIVAQLHVSKGSSVNTDELLAVITPQ
ncbi:MAG: Glutaconyl-CoA decarboxylase subunit gamma [Firmicutes bacterium ADurb.Bin262]|nr:MAG: Glutaconyl-CoA decarboxylase subunit gamma [Firmicutes bacterium ADurb.Bin262]